VKPTDRKQYLHYNSSHPLHIKKSILYSQALRYRRIIDDDTIFHTELQKLKQKFLQRNYPLTLINEQIDKVINIRREHTLTYKTELQKRAEFFKYTNNKPFLPLIITYHNNYAMNKSLLKQLSTLWEVMINKTDKLKACFGDILPKIVYNKGYTIANSLIKANYSTYSSLDNTIQILSELNAENNEELNICKVTSCRAKLCKLCNSIIPTNNFNSAITGKTYNINTDMNCNSTCCIYLICCTKCHKQYVGETKRKLKDRINNHRSNIMHNKPTAISLHFNDVLHTIKDLSVIPIEIVHNEGERKNKEQYWIKELYTKYPHGLNHYPINPII